MEHDFDVIPLGRFMNEYQKIGECKYCEDEHYDLYVGVASIDKLVPSSQQNDIQRTAEYVEGYYHVVVPDQVVFEHVIKSYDCSASKASSQ